MSITRIQDTIGSKIDVDGRKMDILALVLCGSSGFDGIDLTFTEPRQNLRRHDEYGLTFMNISS